MWLMFFIKNHLCTGPDPSKHLASFVELVSWICGEKVVVFLEKSGVVFS